MNNILITGSQGTGKTTLANALSKELDLPVLPEMALEAKERGLELNSKNMETQLWICFAQMLREDELIHSGNRFIADRSFDHFCYSVYFDLLPDLAKIQIEKFLIERTKRIYSKIIFLRPSFEIEEIEEIRSNDIEYQRSIDDLIHSFLIKGNFDYLTLGGNSIENRIEISKLYILDTNNSYLEDIDQEFDLVELRETNESDPRFFRRCFFD